MDLKNWKIPKIDRHCGGESHETSVVSTDHSDNKINKQQKDLNKITKQGKDHDHSSNITPVQMKRKPPNSVARRQSGERSCEISAEKKQHHSSDMTYKMYTGQMNRKRQDIIGEPEIPTKKIMKQAISTSSVACSDQVSVSRSKNNAVSGHHEGEPTRRTEKSSSSSSANLKIPDQLRRKCPKFDEKADTPVRKAIKLAKSPVSQASEKSHISSLKDKHRGQSHKKDAGGTSLCTLSKRKKTDQLRKSTLDKSVVERANSPIQRDQVLESQVSSNKLKKFAMQRQPAVHIEINDRSMEIQSSKKRNSKVSERKTERTDQSKKPLKKVVKLPRSKAEISNNSLETTGEIGTSKYWSKAKPAMKKQVPIPATESRDDVGGVTRESTCTEDSESDSDWEEVADMPSFENLASPSKNVVPEETVEITLEGPDIMKKKKKGFDVEDWHRLQVNKARRESQGNVHKVHILCLLAEGMRLNRACNDVTLQSVALSLVPEHLTEVPKPLIWQVSHLSRMVKWFVGFFHVDRSMRKGSDDLNAQLLARFDVRRVASTLELVLIFVVMCRAIGLDVRFVQSLQPTTFKAADLKPKNPKPTTKKADVIHIDNTESKDKKSSPNHNKSLSSKLSSLMNRSPVRKAKGAQKPRT